MYITALFSYLHQMPLNYHQITSTTYLFFFSYLITCFNICAQKLVSTITIGILVGIYMFPAFSLSDNQVGYDKQGLPIGFQLIGRPWCEATILRLGSAIEVFIISPMWRTPCTFNTNLILWIKQVKIECSQQLNKRRQHGLFSRLSHFYHYFQELCSAPKKKPLQFYDMLKGN